MAAPMSHNPMGFHGLLQGYLYLYLVYCFYSLRQFFINNVNGGFVTQVSLDMIRKYIHGFWIVIPIRAMLRFTWLVCILWLVALY
jgi:hypothetical protein